ncbi:MAG: hypothetical protein KDA32_12685, partial [Phycisphaerales bacterium]|nr:hypothetical protein [Phycisphaerales bacterium]
MYVEKSQGEITDCNFAGNQAQGKGGAILAYQNARTRVLRTRFVENEALVGGGMSVDTLFQNFVGLSCCKFRGNVAATTGGGLATSAQPTHVLDCVFENNRAGSDLSSADCNTPTASGSAGAIYATNSELCLADTLILGNTASTNAGGMLIDDGGPTYVTNCVFGENRALGTGGAILNHVADSYTINNSTFADNVACGAGGAIRNETTSLAINNSILWNNGTTPVDDVSSTTTIRSTLIEGGWSGSGSGNIDADPRFADPAAWDFRLARCSPAVSAGDSNLLPDGLCDPNDPNVLAHDITHGPRVIDTLDLGAYEFDDCPGDATGDHAVDLSDLAALLASFGRSSGQPGYEACAEFTGDAMVALEDLALLLAHFGDNCGGCLRLCSPACTGEEESLTGGGAGPSAFTPGGGGASPSSGPAVTLEVDGFDTSAYTGGGFAGESD